MNEIIQSIFSVVEGVGIVAALLVSAVTLKKNRVSVVETVREMRIDIKYIKDKLSDYDAMRTRLTAVEESAKSAHKRIDSIENARRHDDG